MRPVPAVSPRSPLAWTLALAAIALSGAVMATSATAATPAYVNASAASPFAHTASISTREAEIRAQVLRREVAGNEGPAGGFKPPPPANPGEVCDTNATTVVFRKQTGTEVLYTVASGTPMRIEAYAGPEQYYGHAEGKANGYFYRSSINQSSCHKT